MQRLFWIGLLLLTACQGAMPEATPSPAATPTRLIPSPMPATVTPSVTPAPTFTPTPPPQFFTEEFESALTHWSVLQTSGENDRYTLLRQDGQLTFELNGPNIWVYAIYGAHEYQAVRIRARVGNRGSGTNYIGLVCMYDEQEGWYEFNSSSDGTYSVLYGQWLGTGIASYAPIADGFAERINQKEASNEIGLDCYDNEIWLNVNGDLFRKIDVSRYNLLKGKIGISVASFDEFPVILSFDWITVTQP